MREPSAISSRAGNVNMYVGLLMDVMLYYSPIESQGRPGPGQAGNGVVLFN